MKLLMISTDQKIFQEGSDVARRMVEYAKGYEEVHIVVFQKRTPSQEQEVSEKTLADNCWVYSTQSQIKLMYPFDAIRLGRFIISRRHMTHITCQDPFLTGMVGVSLQKEFKIPLELQVHTDIGSPYFVQTLRNKAYKAMALSYLPKADRIRVVSQRIKTYLTDTVGIEDSKIEIRPIAVDAEKIKASSVTVDLHKKYPQFEQIILMASRIEKEKNFNLALSSFKEVLISFPKAGLLIVGDGRGLSKIKDSVSGGILESSVIIEPWVNRETLFSYYKTTDVFLLTSFFEGYGMTLIEAQTAGCPIVSTDVGVAREAGATIVGYNAREVAEALAAKLS